MGASGIKIDFIPAATAEIMQWYMGAMQDCAELGLLLNFHGSVKPTGLFPYLSNDVTREAVRGNEWHILRYGRVLPQSHYVALPFTFDGRSCGCDSRDVEPREIETGGYTWTHEFAQSIVFLSPITHFPIIILIIWKVLSWICLKQCRRFGTRPECYPVQRWAKSWLMPAVKGMIGG